MIGIYLFLAQATQPVQPPGGAGDFLRSPLVPLVIVMIFLWWFMSRGKNKERQRYEQMLASLKKNDRIQTIGGVIGTVVDVRDNEVVVKVDETNNVKIRFNRTAIKDVFRDAPPGDTKS